MRLHSHRYLSDNIRPYPRLIQDPGSTTHCFSFFLVFKCFGVIVAHVVAFSSLLLSMFPFSHSPLTLPHFLHIQYGPCALFQISTALSTCLYFPTFSPSLSSFLYLYFRPPVGLSFLPLPTMKWDIRSWMPAFVAPACWLSFSLFLLIPSFLPTSHSASPFPQPPEYIKSLYLFYLYVNASRHSSPSLLSPSALQKVPPFALSFLFLQLISPGR